MAANGAGRLALYARVSTGQQTAAPLASPPISDPVTSSVSACPKTNR
jgi:hypothetical protein